MTDKVSVAIPVGPYPSNQQWLAECLKSVREQSYPADEILIIDDMANVPALADVTIYRNPWRIGVGNAFNFGVALARNELVFLLGSDDTLDPLCLERCVKAYVKEDRPGDTYFFTSLRYMDDGEEQFTPCNAAMVTKTLWVHCGGFPIEATTGAPDAALMSIFYAHKDAGKVVGVSRDRPLYNYRRHNESDTAGRQAWQGTILTTRDLVTKLWRQGIR